MELLDYVAIEAVAVGNNNNNTNNNNNNNNNRPLYAGYSYLCT
jgi:hypothetical protein